MLSTDFPDMSIVAIETIPMSVVAVPVSVSYAVVDEGSVFIFTELADKLRLQGCKSKTKHRSTLVLSTTCTQNNSRKILSMKSGKVQRHQLVTWKSVEVVNEVHVFAVGVGGNQIEFLQELGLCGVRGVDNAQGVHLDVGSVGLPYCDVKFDRLPFVRLSVSDNNGNFSDPGPSAEECLLGRLSDCCAGVGALAHVRHFSDCLPHVLLGHIASQVELQMDVQTVEDQADSGGVAPDRGPLHQPGDKVFDDLKVLWADTF